MGRDRAAYPTGQAGGNKRTVNVREVVNGLMYILGTGCQWAALPKDLPPRSTVSSDFLRWQHDRTLDRLHHALYVQCREQAGRNASPTVAIIDSPSVKSAEKGGARTRPVTMPGRRSRERSATSWSTPRACFCTPSCIRPMASLSGLYPFLLTLYADSGYQGPKFQDGLSSVCRQVNVQIIKRSDAGRFVVLPKRWVVERIIAWLNRCRRLAKDWERLNHSALAFLRWAPIRLMVRKLCQSRI